MPRSDWRVDTDQCVGPSGATCFAALGRLACRTPPPSSPGLPRMTPASTSEISAPRRYDVARFFADGNRLLSASIDASQARGVTVQRLPIQSTGPTRSLAFQAVLPLASLARRQHDAGPHDIIGGGDQPAGNHHGARFIGAGGQEPDPSTRVVPSAIDRFICVWKHELIPRTPISTRSRSTNTRRRELAAIRGRVSWRGYVRVGSKNDMCSLLA